MWRPHHLRQLAQVHSIQTSPRDNRTALVDKLTSHTCGEQCPAYVVSFTTLSKERSPEQVANGSIYANPLQTIADESLRCSIIQEWQDRIACAPCGRRITRVDATLVRPQQFDLRLLRNDSLPSYTLPTSYAFNAYNRALLEPKGMTNRWQLADINMCKDCRRSLVDKSCTPRLCLANWLYYAHDTLPPHVSNAFERSSQFDRLLVSRARASRISFRFTELQATSKTNDEPTDSHDSHSTAQRFVRGNVLVMPQNSTQLNAVLPPPPSVIHDTVCAVFVGRTPPTKDTIGRLGPILVRRSIVQTIITFLVTRNPFYTPDAQTFFGFSPTNLNALFSLEDSRRDLAVPCAMDVGFISDSPAIRATTADYTGRNDITDNLPDDSPLLMENIGYTSGDRSPVSYRDMKLRALSHCLNRGMFLRSQAGDTFVPDFHNPALLTWLFPHLDPWGISGFHHPSRTYIKMEEQLTCNSVKASEQRRIISQLLRVNKSLLQQLILKYDHDKHYQPQTQQESDLLALVNSVGAVLHDIPGTSGYKLNMRNEIRALVPNPSDIHHPLVRLYTGDRINLEDPTIGEELTEWRRKLLVARNPAACAMFFHTMISNFISVILRHGRSEAGLFGTCTAYYGTVEAQGHGSLHCHMLIWIKNHPSPQKMRDLMVDDEYYQHRMFTWLESLIKCEPLGTTNIVDAYTVAETHPRRHTNNAAYDHPGGRRLPQINYHDLVNELVHHFNWHDHTETCWKYLRRHQPRIDSNCRMRIDGSTRATSSLDPDTLSIQLRRLHPWISSYNDANMDIKHIGSGEGAKALIYYITDYITKASIPAHLGLAALLYAIDRTDTKFKGIQQWSPREESGALTILEISHAQVMSYLVGGGDHYTSHRYQLLHYHIFERLVLQYWHPNPIPIPKTPSHLH
ncbi:hypothetical protein L226DRAFT_544690 [Lentinus tigrinus ALCF2SS1-7]|uniref:uncharacterized protein n=1 Tax=Lentinus tigrinus ALCF2SS1-7 TaxID=1328758 RepID=UPI001165CBB8|nr:hypothetical protein L226DRAFT_544690 [Lentinus tigrinus ALCF2SS1-7]